MFISTCAGSRGVTNTYFAAVAGRRFITGAGADAINVNAGTLSTPFRPVAVQHGTVVIQRAPALRTTAG